MSLGGKRELKENGKHFSGKENVVWNAPDVKEQK